MSFDNIAIRIQKLSKCYTIYKQPQDRLKQVIWPRLQRITGQPVVNYYRQFWALRDVSFEVKKGETLGIVGRNGSGKSTLLQIICGTLAQSSGTVVTSGQIAALLELGSGFNPEFSGIENIYLYGQILGMSQNVVNDRLQAILDFAGIGDFVHHPVKTYSSGMVVRLAFAVSVAREPNILVVDEALAVGDEAFQRKCFAKINSLRENGTTILFVSHSAALIVELCDRVILLDEGELLFEGTPKKTVALYHKLAFAQKEKKEKICNEIRLDQVERDIQSEPDSTQPKRKKEKSANSSLTAFYDPNLISQSFFEYESLGVQINTPRIETLSGNQVNNLISGHQYIYIYKVIFLINASRVQFGMLLKSTSGLDLGGAAHPSIFESLPFVQKGSELTISFTFRCMLNPGTYFVNAGVLGEIEGQDVGYLHRLIDVIIFRVQPKKGINATGRVNFDISSTIYSQARDK